MNKLLCLLLAIVCIFVVCGCDDTKNQNVDVQPQTTSKNVENKVEEKELIIPDELKSYAKNDLAMTEEELKTAFADFDGDGVAELFQIIQPHWEAGVNFHIFSLVDGKAQEVIVPEEGLEWTFAAITKLEIRKEKGENVIYLTNEYGDGLCGEGSETMILKNKNGVLTKTSIASYSCDSEAEEAKRAGFGDINELTTEQFKEYVEAHTLKYEANGQRLTEEVYHSIINQFEAEHELVAKIK
jgi:hypothetical protein